MIKLFQDTFRIMTRRVKNDIRAKILRLVMSVGLMILMTGGIFSFLGMISTWYIIDSQSEKNGNEISKYTSDLTEQNTKKDLKKLTRSKVNLFDSELQSILYDAKYLANDLSIIFASPEKYSPLKLPNFILS